MDTENTSEKRNYNKWKGGGKSSTSGFVYALGFIGAAFYYIMHATTFWIGVLGIIKAIFWPAILIYKIFEILKL
jgi:hypothetical protein